MASTSRKSPTTFSLLADVLLVTVWVGLAFILPKSIIIWWIGYGITSAILNYATGIFYTKKEGLVEIFFGYAMLILSGPVSLFSIIMLVLWVLRGRYWPEYFKEEKKRRQHEFAVSYSRLVSRIKTLYAFRKST